MLSAPSFSTRILFGVTLCVLAIGASHRPAAAGFEWKPAPAAAPESATPDVPAVPPADVDVVVLDDATQAAPVVETAPAEREPVMRLNRASEAPAYDPESDMAMAAPPQAAPVMAAPAAHAAPSQDPVVEGFGSDLALALAMRQIVPAGYGYIFDPAVDQGARVNWSGGKPWQAVLDDALAPVGLTSRVMGNDVWVGSMASAPAPASGPIMAHDAAHVPHPPMDHTGDDAGVDMAMEPSAPVTEEPAEPSQQDVYLRRGETELKFVGRDQPAAPMTNETHADETSDASGSHSMSGPMSVPGTDDPVPLLPAENEHHAAIEDAMVPPGASAPVVAAVEEEGGRAFDPYEIQYWQAEKGDSLRNVLTDWSKTAGVTLVWDSNRDFRLPTAVRLHGNYADAVLKALTAYDNQTDRPLGKLHPNLPNGPSVLIIDEPKHG